MGIQKVKESHFSFVMFLPTMLVFISISGIHTGLVLVINKFCMNAIWKIVIVMLYWTVISLLFTMFTKWQMKLLYEIPMKKIAEATRKVANGDFSIYVPPIHTIENYDYLDVMIIDFNKMVEELGSIETLKTEFFSNVSHEIKTPIAAILNSAEMLQNNEVNENDKKEYFMSITQSAKKLSTLITNILKLNKLENQNIRPVMEEYNLCDQLCECALQFEAIWEKKNIDFEVNIAERFLIKSDASLLELVWTNLISNALKFTKQDGQVSLNQESTENEVIVTVSDTGCGMTKDMIKHIFDKFYQGDTSHSTDGNGLGLALALRIIQLLEGTIAVESEDKKGTTFIVKLPVNTETYRGIEWNL